MDGPSDFEKLRKRDLKQLARRLTDDLAIVNVRLERANLSFATALVATLDARDRYTAGHSAAVATYARDIAERLGLSKTSSNSRMYAASCTTSARWDFLRVRSRSRALSRSRSAA